MPRIVVIDTNYPEYLAALPSLTGSYEVALSHHLQRWFGTFDAYSLYLKKEGWDSIDIIANYDALQQRWAIENNFGVNAGSRSIVLQQIKDFRPDVVFLQDVSFFSRADLEALRKKYFLAAQISCPMPKEENVRQLQCVFTSFPHYVDRFHEMGIEAHYLPLAFDPRCQEEEDTKKPFDITFVGGVGKRSHWKAGTEVLERVAAEFKDRFLWFGYGRENLEFGSPLSSRYVGSAWGKEQYSIYGRSKVVINRHGEVAEGFSNNLRMFEATGMGALLVTEWSRNIDSLFPVGTVGRYKNVDDLLWILYEALSPGSMREAVAKSAQAHTLKHHTYAQRMKVVSDVLTTALVGQAR